MKKILLLVSCGFLTATLSHAAAVREIAIQSVFSEFAGRGASNIIGNVGLFGDIHTTAPAGNMWLTAGGAVVGDFTNAFIQFDLGTVRTLDHMRVWNYNEAGALARRGIQRADIYTSLDGVTFTTNFPNTFFNIAPGTFGTNFAQTISLGGVSARYVGFKVLTNHVTTVADNFVGLSKVKFYDTNVAPIITLATRNFFGDRVTVLFSDSVTPAAATNIANYSILNNGTNVVINSAVFDVYPNRVVLQTATALSSNLVYTVRATNITDIFTSAKVDPTPVTIESDLVLWLKGDAGVTADASGFVSQWNDQSGAGNNVAQTDPAAQPSVATNANGNPVVRFLPIPQFLEAPHAPSLVVRSDYTIFTVINAVDFTTFNAIVGKTMVNQPAGFDVYTASGTGKPNFYRGNGLSSGNVVGISNVVAGQTVVLGGIMRGTNATTFFNGAFNGASVVMAGVGDAGLPLRVGTRGDLFTKMNGDIAEIMVFRGAVSDAERIAINNYLGAKYGVPIINLAFNQQPVSQTKLEGQIATFSVNVSASSPTVNYQWQRFGTNLPNATNASYATPILTLADNNSTFRVLVTVPGSSSQFSDTATLMILVDREQPTILSAGRKIWNPAEIVVLFSERVQATATNTANYTLDNGATVTSATVGETADKIVLQTTGLTGTNMLSVQSVIDLFGNTISAVQVTVGFYPLPALWLSSRSGVETNSEGYITQWNDLSGNGNHATPLAGPPFTPQLTNGFNNQPVARFDGTNSISLFAPSSPSLAIVGDISIYSIAQFVDRVTYNSFVGKTTVNQPSSYDFYLNITTGLPTFLRGNGVVGTALGVAGTAAPSLDVPHVVSVVMAGTAVAHYLDGITNGAGTLATTLGDNGDGVGIGTRSDGVTRMKGDVAEFIIFGSALSNADRTALDDYFGATYGILVGQLPRLTVVAGAGNITLSWPQTTGFVLESAPVLAGGTWTPITTGITTVGGINSISILSSDVQQFYRLRKP